MGKWARYWLGNVIVLAAWLIATQFPKWNAQILLAMLIIMTGLNWKPFKEKINKAEGEEEIRQEIMPFILTVPLIVLMVLSLFINE